MEPSWSRSSCDRGLAFQPRLGHRLGTGRRPITFTLREGVTFHSGRALTAEDVRYTFETVLDTDFGAPNRSLYTAIDSIETPDDFTVIMNLNQPDAFLLNNIARQPIVPADAAADGAEFNLRPVGTGPYMFESQVRDDRLALASCCRRRSRGWARS